MRAERKGTFSGEAIEPIYLSFVRLLYDERAMSLFIRLRCRSTISKLTALLSCDSIVAM